MYIVILFNKKKKYRIGMFIIWKRRILMCWNKFVGFFKIMLMLLCFYLVYFVVVIVD